MLPVEFLIVFLLSIEHCPVECHFVGSQRTGNERERLEKRHSKRDLHLKMFLRDEENDMSRPSCTSKVKRSVAMHIPASHQDLVQFHNTKRLKRQLTSSYSPRDNSPYGTAAYFSGTLESLKYTGSTALPSDQFSVGVWVKPEGGQNVPVHFLGKMIQLLYLVSLRMFTVGTMFF